MKKFLFVLTAVVMIFSIAACGESDASVYELYKKAADATNAADSFEADASLKMLIKSGGQTVDQSIDMAMKLVKNGESMDMQMSMSGAMFANQSVEMFIKDNNVYMQMQGMKLKLSGSEQYMSLGTTAQPVQFPESAIKEKQIEDVSEGKKINLVIDGKVLSETLFEQVGSTIEGSGLTENDINVGDVKIEAVIGNDDLMKSIKMSFEMSMSLLGQNASIEYEISLDYKQIGNVTIEFPTDLDTYTEMTDLGF